jgi:hypothetical protein
MRPFISIFPSVGYFGTAWRQSAHRPARPRIKKGPDIVEALSNFVRDQRLPA